MFRDYLFELINLAEGADADGAQLRFLAERAASLDDVPEIDITVTVSAAERVL